MFTRESDLIVDFFSLHSLNSFNIMINMVQQLCEEILAVEVGTVGKNKGGITPSPFLPFWATKECTLFNGFAATRCFPCRQTNSDICWLKFHWILYHPLVPPLVPPIALASTSANNEVNSINLTELLPECPPTRASLSNLQEHCKHVT
jgi:hypothetical protein